ncbi:MAG: putative membrane protein [Cellvibrionaceae bacterium]|jgi:uncharacterized membrane protein
MDLHPIFVHFPIALVTISVITAWIARFNSSWPALKESSWLMFWIAAIAAVPTAITGLIAHAPYEETILLEVIETHQFSALAATLLLVGVSIWRWRARQKGSDVGDGWAYLLIISAIFGLYLFVGSTGGDLVYDYAINVNAVNILLPGQ